MCACPCHQREPQLAGGLDPGDAEGKLGGHVDDVGPEALQVGEDVAHPRERPLDIGIQEERHAGRAMDFRPGGRPPGPAVVRRIDPDLVPTRLQRLGESQERHPDPAHHRPVDFGEQGYAHAL